MAEVFVAIYACQKLETILFIGILKALLYIKAPSRYSIYKRDMKALLFIEKL